MAVNEQIVTGRKFRKLIDEVNKIWLRISFWTKASDVEFNDGKNAETKIGAINGVTDSLTSTASNIAASAAAIKALNDKVTELNGNLNDAIYDAIKAAGVTPASKNYADLATAIASVKTNNYNSGYNAGRNVTKNLRIDYISGQTNIIKSLKIYVNNSLVHQGNLYLNNDNAEHTIYNGNV